MIPRRISLDGFKSYRDRATLLFDGAPLWVLAGRNGAGKSAIFDAITFVLYGTHRGRSHDAVELINHQSNRLAVEFDFALGDDVYQVKRTLQRKGRASVQVFYLSGPNPPRPGQKVPHTVPRTESSNGFRQWVKNTIGLNDKTFTASVLLQQGKSDAMLEADPVERHKMLSQLVDLLAYDRLCRLAEAHHKDARAEAKAYQTQLGGLEPVDDDVIQALAVRIEQLRGEVKKAQTRLQELASLKVKAQRWAELEHRRKEVDQTLADAQQLFTEAEQIQRDAARLTELRNMLPLLQRLLEEHRRLEACDRLITQNKGAGKQWGDRLRASRRQLRRVQHALARLERRQKALPEQHSEASRTLLELTPDLEELKQSVRARHEVRQCHRALIGFASDLDEQVTRLEEEVKALTELRIALPWLRQYATVRVTWRKAKGQATRAEAEASKLKSRLSAISIRHEEVKGQAQQASARAAYLDAKLTESQTLLGAAQKHLQRFQEVDGQPACRYCGQPLTPKHLKTERQRLMDELRAAAHAARRADQEHDGAVVQQRVLEKRAKGIESRANALDSRRQQEEEALRLAQQEQTQAEAQGRVVLDALPQSYGAQIRSAAGGDIITWIEAQFPSRADLSSLDKRAARYEARKQRCDRSRERTRERDRVLDRASTAKARLRELEEKYPAERAQEIRAAQAAANRMLRSAQKQSEALARPLREAEQLLDKAERAVKEAEAKQRGAATSVHTERARRQELARTVVSLRRQLPDDSREADASLTKEHLAGWRAEAESLAGADSRLSELADARRQHESRGSSWARLSRN